MRTSSLSDVSALMHWCVDSVWEASYGIYGNVGVWFVTLNSIFSNSSSKSPGYWNQKIVEDWQWPLWVAVSLTSVFRHWSTICRDARKSYSRCPEYLCVDFVPVLSSQTVSSHMNLTTSSAAQREDHQLYHVRNFWKMGNWLKSKLSLKYFAKRIWWKTPWTQQCVLLSRPRTCGDWWERPVRNQGLEVAEFPTFFSGGKCLHYWKWNGLLCWYCHSSETHLE